MFALRWLILYQHVFQKKGFEQLTELFREMEVTEYERNYDLVETTYVKNFVSNLTSLNYPIKGGLTSDTDIESLNMMIEEERGGDIS